MPMIRCALLIAASLLLPAVPGFAADPPKPAAATAAKTKPKPIEPVMTRAELRECLALQDRNKAQDAELLTEQQKLLDEKARLQGESDAQKETLATLDRSNAEAVAKYNEQVTARNAAVDALQSRSVAFNSRVEASQAARASYASSCGNRRFDERDEAAIRSGK